MIRLTLLATALALLLCVPTGARADLLKDAGQAIDDGVKQTRKVVKKVKKKVKKAGKVVEEEVDEEVELVLNGSGQVVGEVDKATGKAVRLALKGQKALEKTFSKDVVDDIVEGIDATFKGAQQAPMWSAVVARMKQARPAAERAARDTRELAERVRKSGEQWKDEFDDAYAFIDKITRNDAAQKKLGRLFQRVAKGQFGDETLRLAQWVADEALDEKAPPKRAARPRPQPHPAGGTAPGLLAGPVQQRLPGGRPGAEPAQPGAGYPLRSLGVTLGWNVSAHVAVAGGFEGRFGVVMDIDRAGKVSDVRAIYTLAEGLGAGVSATGAGIDLGVDIMVGISALPVKNASGLFFGPSGSAGAVVSGNVGLDWGWVGDNPAPAPIPGLAAGPGLTDPDPSIGVLVLYGYAVTANDKGFDHGIPGLPAK